jgi:hypothetical protein
MPIVKTFVEQPPDLPGLTAVQVWQKGGQMGEEGWVWTYVPASPIRPRTPVGSVKQT